ncbi:Sphingolipid long chain base-responsive protein PIL1 [Leucoagaricus sp. SymC.cos]|nr:Sphingolipid long chain base-responsive protein PIL1 [Leucoagaricus sp. SymC.cos]
MFRSAATKIAHNSTIPALAGNQDLRALQDLITAEKAVIISLQRLSADFSKASEALKTWGLGEGEDLGNVLSSSTTIITHLTSALSQYASHGHTMREQLKAIRTREENLDELKRRRRSVMSKADSAEKKLQKMGPEHKNLVQQTDLLNRLSEEIRGLDMDIMQDEAALGDFKRAATRSWLGLKFGGLLELCEKGVSLVWQIVGEYGKLVVSEIPEDETQPGLPRNPYLGYAKVEGYLAEAHRCVNEVRLSTVPSSSQPRRHDQQLPQVPSVSESPFMNQASFTSSPYPPQIQPPVGSYHEDVSRRDILPEPQGLGTGRFLDSPIEASTSPFSQAPQQPQYSGSLPSASAFQSQSGRHVDEFGSTMPSGPIDALGTGGGRFATFPVKARSGSVGNPVGGDYQFRLESETKDYDGPLSLLSTPPHREQSDSFSSSVAQALAATSRDSRDEDNEPLPPPGRPGRFSKDGPAPSYEASIDSESPWSNSPNMKLGPNDHLAPTHNRQTSNLSDDGALLTYMSPSTASADPAPASGGGAANDKHVSRHVRFGTVSEIDDAPLPPITPQDSVFSPSPEPTVGAPGFAGHPSVQGGDSSDHRAQSSHGEQAPHEREYNPYEEQEYEEGDRSYLATSGFSGRSQPASSLPRISVPPRTSQPGSYSYYDQSPVDSKGGGGAAYDPPKTYASSPSFEKPQPPNAPYMRPGANRSTSSLNSGGTGGGGKISAAAFKRPSPRTGGSSSPFAPPSPSPWSSTGGGKRASPTEGRRLPSPWEADSTPAYPSGQGNTQPLHIKKREIQELDADQYDYINAYVNSGEEYGQQGQGYGEGTGGPTAAAYYAEQVKRAANANASGGGWAGIGSAGATGQQAGAGGYGQGKFATNLE